MAKSHYVRRHACGFRLFTKQDKRPVRFTRSATAAGWLLKTRTSACCSAFCNRRKRRCHENRKSANARVQLRFASVGSWLAGEALHRTDWWTKKKGRPPPPPPPTGAPKAASIIVLHQNPCILTCHFSPVASTELSNTMEHAAGACSRISPSGHGSAQPVILLRCRRSPAYSLVVHSPWSACSALSSDITVTWSRQHRGTLAKGS